VGRIVLIVLVVFVVLILVVGVLAYLFLPASSSVTITVVDFRSADDACGLDGATSGGFTANVSETYSVEFTITGNNSTGGGTAACHINSVTTSTPGFSISGAEVPVSIPANSSGNLTFDLTTPGSSYKGALTLVLT